VSEEVQEVESGDDDSFDAFDTERVIRELEKLRRRSSAGLRAKAIRDAGKKRAAAVGEYDKAKARIRRKTEGTAQAKDDAATLDERFDELRSAAEDAKTAERYAKDLADEHESNQSNLQTQSRLIEKVLGIGGANR
jgi:hypothetical protein